MIAVCGLRCQKCGAILGIKERDGDLMSDRYYRIREPKTSQAKRPVAYLWRMLEMRSGVA
jgi:hypothetical protein